ncbi:MAG: DUF423 domain-containing protein [Elusimicrobia bacterium]|nr:DUF423 domain-containing protein [Elusimicrobiota bacterium]
MLLAVALGAFGAHALRGRLGEDLLAVFETGVRYQAYHALALLALAAWLTHSPSRAASIAALCFIGGIIVFSGSLYALALTGVKRWGAVTPLGGLLFLAGWAVLAAGGWRR